MRKIWLIVGREYWTRVRKKSFILATFLAPLGFAIFFIAVIMIQRYSESRRMISVKDESGYFINKLKDADDQTVYFRFSQEPLDTLVSNLRAGGVDGVLYIPQDFNPQYPHNIRYFSIKQMGLRSKTFIERELANQVRNIKIQEYDLDRRVLRDLDANVRLNSIVLGEEEEGRKGYSELASLLGMLSGFAIYLTLFIYGTMVMKGVMEEKANRIVEVLISSVKPFELLLGKIVGIGAVGVTQFLLWGILMFFIYIILGIAFIGSIEDFQAIATQGQDVGQPIDQEEVMLLIENLQSINFFGIFVTFLFYFLGGYLLYGALFAAIGSATNDEGDMQSLTMPVSVPIIISIVIMMAVVNDPDSKLAFWASIIPLSSPVIMPALIPFGVPWWQIALSGLCLMAGFLFTTYIAAKIYRTGILMQGKKITLKELGRWMLHPD